MGKTRDKISSLLGMADLIIVCREKCKNYTNAIWNWYIWLNSSQSQVLYHQFYKRMVPNGSWETIYRIEVLPRNYIWIRTQMKGKKCISPAHPKLPIYPADISLTKETLLMVKKSLLCASSAKTIKHGTGGWLKMKEQHDIQGGSSKYEALFSSWDNQQIQGPIWVIYDITNEARCRSTSCQL